MCETFHKLALPISELLFVSETHVLVDVVGHLTSVVLEQVVWGDCIQWVVVLWLRGEKPIDVEVVGLFNVVQLERTEWLVRRPLFMF